MCQEAIVRVKEKYYVNQCQFMKIKISNWRSWGCRSVVKNCLACTGLQVQFPGLSIKELQHRGMNIY
jgi:hypothetical protein